MVVCAVHIVHVCTPLHTTTSIISSQRCRYAHLCTLLSTACVCHTYVRVCTCTHTSEVHVRTLIHTTLLCKACACDTNVRVCTQLHTRKHLRLLCICSVTMLPPPCLGTTANSLRGVNFEQTQTSRKTISNHSSKPGILKLVDLVLKKCRWPQKNSLSLCP